MESINGLVYSHLTCDPKKATKTIADILFINIYPLMLRIRNKLQAYDGVLLQEEVSKLQDMFTLCTSQINKCLQTLFDIFKTEYYQGISLQESRQCTLERLSWCVNRLERINQKLNDSELQNDGEYQSDSMMVTPMYFVNWIDHTFQILAKLTDIICKTDYKKIEELNEIWKNDILECVGSLHISLDELLLSAMTLCKYCLPSDQHIVKARCQVVLRESKALLSELIDGDLNSAYKVTAESLKLPIMPSNVNILIDVLKDVLYALETNTNTALLALVVDCFCHSPSPVDVLTQHFANTKGTCACLVRSSDDPTEDCAFVKEFDLYNERLLQIGSFAVSCSSDQSRILCLRSGLASLEALDPHLVPAIMLSSDSHHAKLLIDSWRQEVREIRDSIFLIVDPAAFAAKSKQIMNQRLVELIKKSTYDNSNVCSIINIGCVVVEFFSVYTKLEPDALTQLDKLQPLLADLYKVEIECKIVSNLLSSGDDFVYDVKKSKNNAEVTLDQLVKRLKLLYTLVSRINTLLHPRENEELFDCDLEDEAPLYNATRTVRRKNVITYVQSPRKPANMSRSIFARTTNVRSSTNKLPLQRLQNFKVKQREELSFSVQLDELFNLSEVKDENRPENLFVNKPLSSLREPSILYNFSPMKRASLRKAVLNKHRQLPVDDRVKNKNVETMESNVSSDKGSLMDETTSLQITDILNQMSDITNVLVEKSDRANTMYTKTMQDRKKADVGRPSVLRFNVNANATNNTITKHIWNIPVNASAVEMILDDSAATTVGSNVTLPSHVTTLERINDIDLVESKLNSLKTLDLETSV